MSSFWRRHKRRIVAAAAVGAAGAAAAYWWWYSSEEQEQQQRREAAAAAELQALSTAAAAAGHTGGSSSSRHAQNGSSDSSAAAAAAAASLDDSLAAHFNSIQELSDRQALEELLPRLQDLLLARTDYQPLRDQLRAPTTSASLSSQEKLELWRGLASHSFSRALGSVWLVPLLDLLVRLKLHVVGRHMYLESKLPQFQPQGRTSSGGGALAGLRPSPHSPFNRLALPPTLTDKAKEEFFRCDYFIDAGAAGLLVKLRTAVDSSLAAVDFAGCMTPQAVESLVINIHAVFEASFMRGEDLWADYLVAPGPAPVSVRTGSGVEALLSPLEAGMVDELNQELRGILRDFKFVEALRAAVRHTSKGMGAYISSKMGSGPPQQQQQQQQGEGLNQQQQQQRPFPYVVPIVAKSGQLLFEETGRASKGISGLREVQALCASVFTFGPNIC